MNKSKPTLLLHVCCAPCSTHVIQILERDFNLTAYFYNPNIHPVAEYQTRLKEMKGFARKVNLELIVEEYESEKWFGAVKGYEGEREGGKRCEICYRLRLEKTAKFAKENEFQLFTTTLTISPHKDARPINAIGGRLSRKYGLKYYSADFKKKDGFKHSVQLSRKYGLYRQDYCGCMFSKREREKIKNISL